MARRSKRDRLSKPASHAALDAPALPAEPRWGRRDLLIAFGLMLAVLLAYLPALGLLAYWLPEETQKR